MTGGATPPSRPRMVLSLCSPLASLTTGQVLTVDGGQTAH